MLMDFLLDRLNICDWDFPRKEEIEKAERMLGNIGSSVLTDEERKNIILESFELNPYSDQLRSHRDRFPDSLKLQSFLTSSFPIVVVG